MYITLCVSTDKFAQNKTRKRLGNNNFFNLRGFGMGTLLVLVSPCFRENVAVTCKMALLEGQDQIHE